GTAVGARAVKLDGFCREAGINLIPCGGLAGVDLDKLFEGQVFDEVIGAADNHGQRVGRDHELNQFETIGFAGFGFFGLGRAAGIPDIGFDVHAEAFAAATGPDAFNGDVATVAFGDEFVSNALGQGIDGRAAGCNDVAADRQGIHCGQLRYRWDQNGV